MIYGIFMEVLDESGNIFASIYQRKIGRQGKISDSLQQDRGSAAVPTAGLHFTEELIEKIKAQGCKFADLTYILGWEHLNR